MSNFDPTTNRIPFGLMTDDEKKVLKEWPHGFDVRSPSTSWMCHSSPTPTWSTALVYRGKPAPVVTSVWRNIERRGKFVISHSSRSEADFLADDDRIAVLRIDTCNGVSTAHLE